MRKDDNASVPESVQVGVPNGSVYRSAGVENATKMFDSPVRDDGADGAVDRLMLSAWPTYPGSIPMQQVIEDVDWRAAAVLLIDALFGGLSVSELRYDAAGTCVFLRQDLLPQATSPVVALLRMLPTINHLLRRRAHLVATMEASSEAIAANDRLFRELGHAAFLRVLPKIAGREERRIWLGSVSGVTGTLVVPPRYQLIEAPTHGEMGAAERTGIVEDIQRVLHIATASGMVIDVPWPAGEANAPTMGQTVIAHHVRAKPTVPRVNRFDLVTKEKNDDESKG